jgi:lipopolysaccharide export LptBFGC system permease protein LptF
MLEQIVERMAKLAPSHHRELVRGMMSELDSIVDPAERARFALGAIAAIARLSLSGYGRASVLLGDPENGANLGGPSMPKLTTRKLLLRHIAPFAISLTTLTILEIARRAAPWAEQLSSRGAPDAALIEVLLLALPSALALTIPMSVFLAVAWVFTRLGREGVLAAARRERRGVRRLVAPVLGAAGVVATLTLASNLEVLPRANARFVEVLAGAPRGPTDRTMTFAELRAAAQTARTAGGAGAVARADQIEVELHKKLAISAASVILALVAAAVAIRFPGGGLRRVLGASGLMFTGYYLLLVAGEYLADRQLLSPLVGMWMGNGMLLAVALFLLRRPSDHAPAQGTETLALNGG